MMNMRYLALLLVGAFTFSCTYQTQPPLFKILNSEASGIDFNNRLVEDDTINILDNEFVYNGSGVAIADLNNDELPDLIFTGNQVANKIYLNRGELQFSDISKEAGFIKPDSLMWSAGVSVIDVNADGLNDIYVCNTFRKQSTLRKNLLYINQGLNEQGLPVFIEKAAEYGLDNDSYSSNAQFFDADNDGDLDVFIGVNQIDGINPNEFRPKQDDGTSPSRDRLLLNSSEEGKINFRDVSATAGIKFHGYTHSALTYDFNEDGFLDIFVANDFLSNDLLYINNQDGTFSNQISESFKHLSLSSMGSDIGDINSDGRADLYVTEMQPFYNKRKKLFQGPSNYQKEIFTKRYGFEKQYARNVLHVNQGVSSANRLPVFSDLGMMAKVQETDWSWTPLFMDADNDGLQDLFVTNGFPKDVTDRDFGDFRVSASRLESKERLLAAIPEIKVSNFIFKNKGAYDFEDYTQKWGLDFGTYSHGAAYGDLDGDGDLDLVVNNMNDAASVLVNQLNTTESETHWVAFKLQGPSSNKNGIGAELSLYTNNGIQSRYQLTNRGYLSQSDLKLHFGLGTSNQIDSVLVNWPGNKSQVFYELTIDGLNTLTYDVDQIEKRTLNNTNSPQFANANQQLGLDYLSRDIDFVDFNFQRTIPHKFSSYGPSIAVGDVNADGIEDFFISASRNFNEVWFMGQSDGSYTKQEVNYKANIELEEEDSSSLLFDADQDGDLDLYIARGCAQYPENHPYYKDELWMNDGAGNFTLAEDVLPEFLSNTSAVKAADFDRDGDLDLIVSASVKPFTYPYGDSHYILVNELDLGSLKFSLADESIAPVLSDIGMLSDVLWTDYNNDGWVDLLLAGDFMPITFLENRKGKFKRLKNSGLEDHLGWWSSLSAADFDRDGDMDYVVGNIGRNINTQAKADEPIRIYAKDLDQNGTIDPLVSYFLRDSLGVKKEYLYHPWDDISKQFVGIRKRFNSYGQFGELSVPDMFEDGLLADADVYTLNEMNSVWIENLSNGKFKIHYLDVEAQIAPIFGTLTTDIDADGYTDILLVGNDFGMEVQQGPADAFNGLVLRNNQQGSFAVVPKEESAFYVPGNARALATVFRENNPVVLASVNNDTLQSFVWNNENQKSQYLKLAAKEVTALVNYSDGSTQKIEQFYGDGFMSQSSRFLTLSKEVSQVETFNAEQQQIRLLKF